MEELRNIKNANLIVTPYFENWLLTHLDDSLSEEIISIIVQEFRKPPYDDKRRLGGSSAGTCLRKQVLSYLGTTPTSLPNNHLRRIFHDGNWRHLRWQAALLSAGIVSEIEVTVEDPETKVRGKIDAVGFVHEDHPNKLFRGKKFAFELKGAHDYAYRSYGKEGWRQYGDQMVRYLNADPTIELYVLVVENKNTNDYKEWVIRREDLGAAIAREHSELEALNQAIDTRTLPPMLTQCAAGKGTLWTRCKFGGDTGQCVQLTEWPVKKRVIRPKNGATNKG
jgi:hypothetical protein